MNIQDGEKDNGALAVDDTEGPAEIDLSNEDLSTSESNADEDAAARAAAAAAEDKKKNRVPAEKRINTLTRRAKEAEETATRIARELEEERRKNQELAERASRADRAAFANYERSVSVSYDAAVRAHEEALTGGDPKVITAAQQELTKWSTEKQEIERFKLRQPKPEESRERQPEQRQEQGRQQPERRAVPETIAPEAKNWATETAWFNPESDAFNEDMHTEAVAFAAQLERRMVRQGRAAEIGKSPEYFKAIEDHIKTEFPDEFEDVVDIAAKPNGKTPMMEGGRPDTAPPGRSAAPGVGSTPNLKVSLSGEEVDMVKRYMTMGVFRNKDGKKVTDIGEAKRLYAIQKFKSEQADKQRDQMR